MEVPPNSTTRFGIDTSVPDTAAAGQVSIIVRVHRVDDATTLDSCVSSIYVRDAPNAGVPVVIVPDLVRLEWSTRMRPSAMGIVELQRDGEGWHPEGGIYADAEGRCAFEDRGVTPGSTVEYRMRAMYNGLAMVSAVTTVHVPELTPLAIAGLRPNPSRESPVVTFTLPQRAPARLDVFDLAGRRVWARDLGVLAPGPHVQSLEPNGALRSGVYVFRLTCGDRNVSVRGVIAR